MSGPHFIPLSNAGERIEFVQDLLDYNHITTMQIYDKGRRSVRIPPRTRCQYEMRGAGGIESIREGWKGR
jgi:hypothetical protein